MVSRRVPDPGFPHRPASIQVNYLGYPSTMGADFIDYVIVDPFVVPPNQQFFFSERLVYLPDCYQCNDDKREIAEQTPSRAECGLPDKGFVFCCFNDSYKITPALFSTSGCGAGRGPQKASLAQFATILG